MKLIVEVQHKGITLRIRKRTTVRNGTQYSDYVVADYSSGKRVRHARASLVEAKTKAREICEAIASGKREVVKWSDRVVADVRRSMELLHPHGINLLGGATIVTSALATGIKPDEIALACKCWQDRRPDKFTPKPVRECVDEFLARRQSRISERRHRTDTCYLGKFKTDFAGRNLHEITPTEIADWTSRQDWSRKTRNDVLSTISLLYRDAIQRSYATSNPAAPSVIKREKLRGTTIGIFMPDDARKMLSTIDENLRPFMSLWFFGGTRKEEAARVTWEQVDAGLASGSIYLRADQTKTGEARSLPISENLKAWLMAYRKPVGPVLPQEWQGMQRLDDLAKTVARQSRLTWVRNGPRHSFGTFHLKLHGDPALTVRVMGTSLDKLQRHYASRSDSVTKEAAQEWFGIRPETANIIQLPSPQTDGLRTEATGLVK